MKKINIFIRIFKLSSYLLIYFLGLITGALVYHSILLSSIERVFTNNNIEVNIDLNETQLIKEFNETIYPRIMNDVKFESSSNNTEAKENITKGGKAHHIQNER